MPRIKKRVDSDSETAPGTSAAHAVAQQPVTQPTGQPQRNLYHLKPGTITGAREVQKLYSCINDLERYDLPALVCMHNYPLISRLPNNIPGSFCISMKSKMWDGLDRWPLHRVLTAMLWDCKSLAAVKERYQEVTDMTELYSSQYLAVAYAHEQSGKQISEWLCL